MIFLTTSPDWESVMANIQAWVMALNSKRMATVLGTSSKEARVNGEAAGAAWGGGDCGSCIGLTAFKGSQASASCALSEKVVEVTEDMANSSNRS